MHRIDSLPRAKFNWSAHSIKITGFRPFTYTNVAINILWKWRMFFVQNNLLIKKGQSRAGPTIFCMLICEGHLFKSMLSPIMSHDISLSLLPDYSKSSIYLNMRLSIFSVCLCTSFCFCFDAADDDTRMPSFAKVSLTYKAHNQ